MLYESSVQGGAGLSQEETFSGTMRLLNLVFIFVLMLVSIQFSYDVQARASIRSALDARFNIAQIEKVPNKAQLWKARIIPGVCVRGILLANNCSNNVRELFG